MRDRDNTSAWLAQFQKGKKEGLEEGEKKGIKKIAKQMLEDGEPIEKIKKWTGLSTAKINALK